MTYIVGEEGSTWWMRLVKRNIAIIVGNGIVIDLQHYLDNPAVTYLNTQDPLSWKLEDPDDPSKNILDVYTALGDAIEFYRKVHQDKKGYELIMDISNFSNDKLINYLRHNDSNSANLE